MAITKRPPHSKMQPHVPGSIASLETGLHLGPHVHVVRLHGTTSGSCRKNTGDRRIPRTSSDDGVPNFKSAKAICANGEIMQRRARTKMLSLLAAFFAASAMLLYTWLFFYSGRQRVPINDIRPLFATNAFYLSLVASILFAVLAVGSFRSHPPTR